MAWLGGSDAVMADLCENDLSERTLRNAASETRPPESTPLVVAGAACHGKPCVAACGLFDWDPNDEAEGLTVAGCATAS